MCEENERLKSEVEANRVHKDRLIGDFKETCDKLVEERSGFKADWAWMVSEGFKLVYGRARSCRDTYLVRDAMIRAVFSSGYQHGLREGYEFHAKDVPLDEVPTYSETTESAAEADFVTYITYEPPFLEQLSAVPDVSVDEIRAMSSVVDPPTPSPQR